MPTTELVTSAIEEAKAIDNANEQTVALEKIAIDMAKCGFGEEAARTAGMLIANRADALPHIAEALADPRNRHAFERVAGLAASDEESTWKVCLLLPRVYPAHAREVSRAIQEWLQDADA